MRILLLLISVSLLSVSLTFFSSCYPDPCCPPLPQGKGDLLSYFALYHDHIYVLNNRHIEVYVVASDGTISQKKTIEGSNNNLSIFIRDARLLVNSEGGLEIFDLTDPDSPQPIFSTYGVLSCDPVELSGNYLFASIHVTSTCHLSGQDAVEVIDINNPSGPLAGSVPVGSPGALARDGNTLFVCTGDSGLIVLDISDPSNISEIQTYGNIKATDIIADSKIMVVKTPTGVDQYDYTDVTNIQLLSHIPIQQ